MPRNSDIRRRFFGAVFLAAALIMVVAGQTVLGSRLQGAAFLLYWLACFGCTIIAIAIAFLDVSAVQRRAREQQRELIESTLRKIADEQKLKKGGE